MAFRSLLRRPIVRAAGPAALSVVFASLLFACGSSDDKQPPAKPDPFATPGLLTDREVKAAKAGSPQKAFLTWWQAIQFRDAVTAYALSSPEARDGLTKESLGQEAGDAAAGFAGKPQIVGRTASGSTVVLRASLVFYSGGKKSAVVPQAFEMTKRGRWMLDDLTYLRDQARLGRERAGKSSSKPPPTTPEPQDTDTTDTTTAP